MPKDMEEKLRRQAAEQGLTGVRADRFVYGAMRKTGWTPKREAKRQPHRKAAAKPKTKTTGRKKRVNR